jgi:hypothetical protein
MPCRRCYYSLLLLIVTPLTFRRCNGVRRRPSSRVAITLSYLTIFTYSDERDNTACAQICLPARSETGGFVETWHWWEEYRSINHIPVNTDIIAGIDVTNLCRWLCNFTASTTTMAFKAFPSFILYIVSLALTAVARALWATDGLMIYSQRSSGSLSSRRYDRYLEDI